MLHIHRAERADPLVGALADVLREPLADPLAAEVIAVPSRGIERWISQELSLRLGGGALGSDGVCANVGFPFPGRLIREAVAAGSGIDLEDDPWLSGPLTWPLLSIVDEDPKASMLGPLRAHVGAPRGDGDTDEADPSRRLSAVRHLADLFDRYSVHRPEMVVRWRDGADVGADGTTLPTHHRWQPALWRAVRERIDLPSFAERRVSAIAALRDSGGLLDLPPRLAMFGLTTLPATYLRVVAAIGVHRDVHLLLLHPSRDLWDRVAAAVAVDLPDHPATSALPLRDDDPTAMLPRNPLLRSWGRDIRELQLTAPLAAASLTHHDLDQHADADDRSLLQRLQDDVRADRHPGARTDEGKPRLRPDDRSVQVHDCHGRLRQVEVLRDAVLHLLADDPALELRDVIVMCPDIEVFAPLITAVFGAEEVTAGHADDKAGASDAPPALRVRLADRALRRTNPVLEVVSRILELVDARVTASDVLDLVSRGPVRRRFGFGDDDLDALETWVGDLQIRWGFDADHRRRQGLPRLDAHTWAAGLRRLLLGAAMADDDLRLVGGIAPYDGLEGQATDLAGRLVELVARLEDAVADLATSRPIDAWRDTITKAADQLTATGRDDIWQRLQLHRILDDLVDEATVGGRTCPVAISLAELRVVLAAQLAGRPSMTSHRTGDLTFSTLVPMRSVPHRVVCLLGMDDGVFPRITVPDSDDLLSQAPRVGDRDPRSEDRQLLLDALMAATGTLVVTYAGRDVRTNEDRPPAVPVDELLDAIDRTVAVDEVSSSEAVGHRTRRPRDHVTIRHPLTDHDPRNFVATGLGSGVAPWGFDTAALAAAQARVGERTPARPFVGTPLPAPQGDTIALDDLVDFLTHPARAFVRQRLGLSLPGDDGQTPSEAIPSTLRGLDAWRVGDAIVGAWLDGADAERAVEVIRARGLVPPGELATDDMRTVRDRAQRIVSLCERIGIAPATPRTGTDIDVALPDGRRLTGTVPDTVAAGLLSVGYSRVSPKRRLATWAQWLALVAHDPAGDHRAVTVGRHAWKRSRAQASVLEPARLPHDDLDHTATELLARLVDLHDRGMRAPVPLYCDSSAKSAEQRRNGELPTRYVDKEWETNSYAPFPREDVDPYHLLVLGGQVPTDDLFAERCSDADEASWVDDDDRRLVAYAVRLWQPILDTERVMTR